MIKFIINFISRNSKNLLLITFVQSFLIFMHLKYFTYKRNNSKHSSSACRKAANIFIPDQKNHQFFSFIMDNFPPTSFGNKIWKMEKIIVCNFSFGFVITNTFQSILYVNNVKLNRGQNRLLNARVHKYTNDVWFVREMKKVWIVSILPYDYYGATFYTIS